MSEDYTWDDTAEPTRAQLAARVQELEREAEIDKERRAKLWGAVKYWCKRTRELERENAELRVDWVDKNDVLTQTVQVMEFAEEFKRRAESAEARLNAVPRYTYACLQAKERGEVSVWPSLEEWLEMGEPDGNDDTDAPLKLAALDEDGDE